MFLYQPVFRKKPRRTFVQLSSCVSAHLKGYTQSSLSRRSGGLGSARGFLVGGKKSTGLPSRRTLTVAPSCRPRRERARATRPAGLASFGRLSAVHRRCRPRPDGREQAVNDRSRTSQSLNPKLNESKSQKRKCVL